MLKHLEKHTKNVLWSFTKLITLKLAFHLIYGETLPLSFISLLPQFNDYMITL
jgi:hypothetical protein